MPNLRQVAQLLQRRRVVKFLLLGTALLTILGGVLLLFGRIEIAIGIVLAGQFLVIIHLLGMRTAIDDISTTVVATVDERTARILTEVTRSRETILTAWADRATNDSGQ